MGEYQKVRVASENDHVVFLKVRVSCELGHLMVDPIQVRASMTEHPSEYPLLKIGKKTLSKCQQIDKEPCALICAFMIFFAWNTKRASNIKFQTLHKLEH